VEAKNKLSPSNVDNLDQLKSKLASFNITHIQTIKTEVVAAARFISPQGAEQQSLLLHFKFDQATKTLDVAVKTKDKLLTELAARYFSITLAGN